MLTLDPVMFHINDMSVWTGIGNFCFELTNVLVK